MATASANPAKFITPYEAGNQNQTTTWEACIQFYQQLAASFPGILQFAQIGVSDSGRPIHAGIITADGVFDRDRIRQEQRPVFFNNNGIHPGEPEGIDACMVLVRDFCIEPERLAALGRTVFLFIPVYNVDGCVNRQNTSRVNQDGPELFGFRGNSLHLDLNRDFIKCDSENAQVFNRFFSDWSPDVMVDTHTSNGADYHYTMTLIQTQADKLGNGLGPFLRHTMLPAIYADMQQRGWPTCPYVNPVQDIPDHGIEDFLETPRFSTGYAALHHTIGFMPETHMLKPFADRYASMRALVESVLAFTVANAAGIQQLRAEARQAVASSRQIAVHWVADHGKPSSFLFKGYQAVYKPSVIGNYQRLSYDRSQPWEKAIPYFDHFVPDISIERSQAYLIPQAWRAVIERLQWNGVQLERLDSDTELTVQTYHIQSVSSRPNAYEGHLFHDQVELQTRTETLHVHAGDYLLRLDQPQARYAIETLEPQAHDSYFRWGFFNSVLEKKEAYSDYVFEDTAGELLRSEPELRLAFEQWKQANPDLLNNQQAVLDFIFSHCARFKEPEWRRYPVLRLMQ
ncbi:M14 family zinc carboxypeptidase [Undibacterium sp. TS12]|uniref:M14 family zinc carboxypeptidase n=1 Tax=Undibacterium sp. TS12 TaxID=2908202 RepID=UPI001F4CEC46|nr:M14 family zinc carboxypeptidase [Undibacterium sp. TS12]MCH8622440.1 peptidase M14 [Undibacterium sp. TS12]